MQLQRHLLMLEGLVHMIVDFFGWQERALGWLLAWGTGNVVVGMGGACAADEVVRQIARQAVGWGSIDLLLAINGRRSARRHARTAGPAQVTAAVTRFRRILAINAVLDVFYVLGGVWLVRTAGVHQRRKGVGLGIMLQGAFLGCYDLLLLRGAVRWSGGSHARTRRGL